MEPIPLIAITISAALGIVAVLCAVIGIGFWCMERTRFLAPFVTFMPMFAILGAMAGSWGFAYFSAISQVPGKSDLPLWAWIIGFPVGSVLGGLFGLALAHLLKKRPNKAVDTSTLRPVTFRA